MSIRPAHMAVLALLCACAGAPAAEHAVINEQGPVQRDTVILKADFPPLESVGALFDSATVDVDGDGTAERVELGVTNAGRDERGVMAWDIHTEWAVVVRDGPDSYPLSRQYAGAAAFWIIVGDSTRSAEILVQTIDLSTSRGGTRLEKFVFDRRRGGYVRTGSLEGFGHHALYRGPPADLKTLLGPTSWRGEEP